MHCAVRKVHLQRRLSTYLNVEDLRRLRKIIAAIKYRSKQLYVRITVQSRPIGRGTKSYYVKVMGLY